MRDDDQILHWPIRIGRQTMTLVEVNCLLQTLSRMCHMCHSMHESMTQNPLHERMAGPAAIAAAEHDLNHLQRLGSLLADACSDAFQWAEAMESAPWPQRLNARLKSKRP